MNPEAPGTYLSWVESEIKKQKFGIRPKSLYEPLRYIMGLGGKRLRPLLTMMSYSLYKDDVRRIVPIAAAIEAFHNFTLLHDDIMDDAPLRRGKTTVHKRWNINTAILAGDVMQIKVYDMLLGVDEAYLKPVLTSFNRCATEVCEGQQMDMEFETSAKVTEAEYVEMIRLKTAVLLGLSLEIGAILAGAGEIDKNSLREFGVSIGVGFQLKDDLLDVYGNKKKFGKQVGGDIIANKKTFLLIKALERAKGKDKQELQRWLSNRKNNEKKVKGVTAIYDALKIRELTEKKIATHFEKGFKSIETLSVDPRRKQGLVNFARTIMERQA